MAAIQQQRQYNNSSVPEAIPTSEIDIFDQSQQSILDPNANQLDPNLSRPDYTFSVGKLPVWAKKQMTANSTSSPISCFKDPSTDISNSPSIAPNRIVLDEHTHSKVNVPKGRWGQRLATGDTGVTTGNTTMHEIGTKSDQGDGGSKESSLEGPQNIVANKQVRQRIP